MLSHSVYNLTWITQVNPAGKSRTQRRTRSRVSFQAQQPDVGLWNVTAVEQPRLTLARYAYHRQG